MERYTGKPFLRLLECYVLNAIDELDEKQKDTLKLMEPKLGEVYGMSGTWLEIICKQMEFPESLPDQIRKLWAGYLLQAKERGVPVKPNDFVFSFVNENFPDVIK